MKDPNYDGRLATYRDPKPWRYRGPQIYYGDGTGYAGPQVFYGDASTSESPQTFYGKESK